MSDSISNILPGTDQRKYVGRFILNGMSKLITIETYVTQIYFELVMLEQQICPELITENRWTVERCLQDCIILSTHRYTNSPPSRYCKRKSRKSFSISEGESGDTADGVSYTDTEYTRSASNPDMTRG